MEEILASIRRIISEDDAPPAEDGHAARAYDEDEGYEAQEPVTAAEPEETAAPPEAEAGPEAPPPAADDPEPESQSRPEPAAAPVFRDEPLISRTAERAAVSAFQGLAAAATPAGKGRTLEDLAREMMQPMLRQWMDENLPRIVEAAVRDEVERISRSRVG